MRRLPTIAVIGSAKELSGAARTLAEVAGRLIAEAGCNLLTGGRTGAMTVVSEAFCRTPDRSGVSIGVLPGKPSGISPDAVKAANHAPVSGVLKGNIIPAKYNDWVEIPILTHLPGSDALGLESRNYINMLSADAVIALGGGNGTEAELRIAHALGKPTTVFLSDGGKIGDIDVDTLFSGVGASRNEIDLSRFIAGVLSRPRLGLLRPTFSALAAVYQSNETVHHACNLQIDHSCAIRLSEALDNVVPGIKAKFIAAGSQACDHGFMRGAQDLAALLRRGDVFGVYEHGFTTPGQPPASIMTKQGIAAYMKIPGFGGQGHIDLWNKTAPVGSAYWNAETVWFWELN